MAAQSSRRRTLVTSKAFYPLFWTQFLGATNDNILKNAFILAVVYKGYPTFGLPSGAFVTLIGGLFVLPYVLFSGWSGELSDGVDKKSLAKVIKWLELGIVCIASLGFYQTSSQMLLTSIFLMGTHSAFFGPLKYSLIPEIILTEDLVRGNAWVESGTFLAILLGTILGGLLISLQHGALWTSVALVFTSIAGLYTSTLYRNTASINIRSLVPKSFIKSTILLFHTLKDYPTAGSSVFLISCFWAIGGGVLSLFPAFCKDILNIGETETTGLLASFTLGIGLGSLLCAKLSGEKPKSKHVFLGALGLGTMLMAMSISGQSVAFYVSTLFLAALSSGFFTLPLYVSLQTSVSKTKQSRIIAANNVSNAIGMVMISALLLLFFRLGGTTRSAMFLLGALQFCFVGFFALRFHKNGI